MIPSDVGVPALESLQGMGVNCRDDLSGHAPRNKIGVIEKAYAGDTGEDGATPVHVEGYLYASDFPDVIEELRAEQEELGFSYECKAQLENVVGASPPTARATFVLFTGATILYKNKAAYTKTSLAAESEGTMDKEQLKAMMEEMGLNIASLEDMVKFFSEFKEAITAAGGYASLSVYLSAAAENEQTMKAQAETIKSLTEKVASLETALTDAQTKLNAAAETEYVAKSDYDALKAQADELQATVTSLKGEAEAKQAYARKSAPTSLMAKYVPGEVDDLKAAMEVIDNAEGLDTNAKIALKMQLSEKFGKAK